MFQKPFRVKTQTAIKGSDRKKLRASVGTSFPQLTAYELSQAIPAKEEMTVTKIYTHSGGTGTIYSINKTPVFLELDRLLYPTVYTLWKFPHILTTITTWPQLLKKLLGGADLMLPGVIVKEEVTPSTFKHINKGDLCAVRLNGNLAPVGVGRMAMSGSDMFESGMRGKGVLMVHMLGDELWAFGDKSQPPLMPDTDAVLDDDTPTAVGEGDGRDALMEERIGSLRDTNAVGQASGHVARVECDTEETKCDIDSENVDGVCERLGSVELGECANNSLQPDGKNGDSDGAVGGESSTKALSVEEVDDLLDMCFKCAIKASLKKSDLPILTSTFYRSHVLPFCPAGKTLDIKKSSYKKLSEFLRKKQEENYIKVQQLTWGVDSITEVDKSHLGLRDVSVEGMKSDVDGTLRYQPPEITEMFSIAAALVPLVKPFGYSKGSSLTGQEVRRLITDYVRENKLQSEENRSQVQLDPLLADIVLNKGEGNTIYMSWEDLFSKVMAKAQAAYSVTYPGKAPVISKGKIEGIRLTVEQRASNKKVTLVDNLETFGIDPAEVAHKVQVSVACSTSVNPHPQKGKGLQVLIQGNQIKFLADLLLEKYKIPRTYVTGLEKMPKKKR